MVLSVLCVCLGLVWSHAATSQPADDTAPQQSSSDLAAALRADLRRDNDDYPAPSPSSSARTSPLLDVGLSQSTPLSPTLGPLHPVPDSHLAKVIPPSGLASPASLLSSGYGRRNDRHQQTVPLSEPHDTQFEDPFDEDQSQQQLLGPRPGEAVTSAPHQTLTIIPQSQSSVTSTPSRDKLKRLRQFLVQNKLALRQFVSGKRAGPVYQDTAAVPRGPGAVGPPRDDGAVGRPRDDGAVGRPRGPGAVGPPRDPGAVERPRDNGAVERPRDDGAVERPRGPGAVGPPRGPGAVERPRDNGAVERPRDDGAVERPRGPGVVGPPRGHGPAGPLRGDKAVRPPRGPGAVGRHRDAAGAVGPPRGDEAVGRPRDVGAMGRPRDVGAMGRPRDVGAMGRPRGAGRAVGREGPAGADELDMLAARGARVDLLRSKGRLCHRHVLVPEGPKYDSRGRAYLAAFASPGPPSPGGPGPDADYARTRPPRLLLPRCCNCCRKSVIGCQ